MLKQVILIDPPNKEFKNIRPQLGTLYLAAILLQEGFEVAIIDFTVEKNAWERLSGYLQEKNTICVGVSTYIGTMLAGALEVSAFCRNKQPDLPIVWGGPHPSSASESTLNHPLVDAICLGEGEITFVEMLRAYQSGESLAQVRGIGYKENGKLVFTPPREQLFDMNKLPKLPYHLINLNLYEDDNGSFFYSFQTKRMMSLETSRSCPYRCKYCINSVKNEAFRGMTPDHVMQFLEDIIKMGVRGITINDDNFFSNKKRAFDILESIVKQNWGLEIFVAVRADFLDKLDDTHYDIMKQAGIKLIGIGVESGSNRILEAIDKRESIEVTFRVAQRLAQFGIATWFHFLYGYPGEGIADVMQTHYAMRKILKTHPGARVNLNKLMPIPKTPLFNQCVKMGWHAPEKIEEWMEIHSYIAKGLTPYYETDVDEWCKESLRTGPYSIKNLPELEWLRKSEFLSLKKTYDRILPRVELFNTWLKKKQAGKITNDFFNRQNINNVAIYGLGMLGERLIEELQHIKIPILYVLDQNALLKGKQYAGIPLISPDGLKQFPVPDLIIVTVLNEFESISQILHSQLPESTIIKIEDLINNFS